jgi:PAS domain-containing protein
VIVEQLRIFKANREFRKKDEIFQAVTENAADMIALVDVKGRRLYNSPGRRTLWN